MDMLKALYTTTDGRISRREWWLGVLGIFILSLVLSIVMSVIGLGGTGWGELISFAIVVYPSWCIGLKRRQDRDNDGTDFKVLIGLSGLLTLLQSFGIGVTMTDMGNGMIVPVPDTWMSVVYFALGVFGIYMLVQLGFLAGTPGANTYGADPLNRAGA